MGPCFKSYLSYKFDRPETICDPAKMNLPGHHVWTLPWNYFEPCNKEIIIIIIIIIVVVVSFNIIVFLQKSYSALDNLTYHA